MDQRLRRTTMRRFRLSLTFISACLTLGTTSPAIAQYAEDALRFSQMNYGIGPRTLALGGTSIGRADDFSALFANPAGLSALRDYEISMGFSRNGISNDATYLGNLTSGTNNNI